MECGIVMRIIGREDDGMLTLSIGVSSCGFTGSARVYTTAPALEQLCAGLQSFPGSASQPLGFALGEPGSYAYFGAEFSVLDARGRWQCQARLESNYLPMHGPGSKHRVEVDMGIEPNAIDRFTSELRNMLNSKMGEAILEGIEKF